MQIKIYVEEFSRDIKTNKIILRIDTNGRNRKQQFDFNEILNQFRNGKN